MARMSVEIEGSVDEVIGVLLRLGIAGRRSTVGDADRSTERPGGGVGEPAPAAQAQVMAAADEVPLVEWTETLVFSQSSSVRI